MSQVLSIIIPAYNEAKTIHRILDKVKAVKLIENIKKEVIIVNDFSKDDTEGAILKYQSENPELPISYFKHEKNKGKGAALHTGIEKATGEFIGWSGIKFNTGDKEEIGGYRDFYDIGYRFIPRYWGKGYASESSFKTLDFGFNELQIETMCGAAEVENIASNKVLQKIGLRFTNDFMFDGEKINWYELNKEDYGKSMS